MRRVLRWEHPRQQIGQVCFHGAPQVAVAREAGKENEKDKPKEVAASERTSKSKPQDRMILLIPGATCHYYSITSQFEDKS